MSFRINRPLDWMKKLLGHQEETGVETLTPGTVIDNIQANIDAIGWERLAELDSYEVSVAGPATEIDGPTVPGGECWIVHRADVRSDVAPPGVIFITYANVIGKAIDSIPGSGAFSVSITKLSDAIAIPAFIPIASERPVFLPPGNRLVYIAQPGIAGGSTLFGRAIFTRLPIGGYQPATNPF